MDGLKVIHRTLGFLTSFATWGIILCVLFAVCTLFIPRFFGTSPYIVLSSSMEPNIHTGSLVYITKTDSLPDAGDVIAYETGSTPVVHRIIETTGTGYITKGDANGDPDMNEVKPSEVLGTCSLTVPYAGYLLSAFNSHMLRLGPVSMPFIVPAAIVIIILLYGAWYITGLYIEKDES